MINDGAKTKALFVKDITEPATGTNAKIRFVNISPDATSDLNMVTDKSTTPIFSNTGFKEYGVHDIRQGIYSFDILSADTNDVITSLEKVKITSGTYYTIIARGYNTSSRQYKQDRY